MALLSPRGEFLRRVDQTISVCTSIDLAVSLGAIDFGETAAALFCNKKCVLKASFYAIELELKETKTQELLFRGDSFCTRFFSCLLNTLGVKYLKQLLTPIIRAVEHVNSLTIDPSVEEAANIEQNTQQLLDICTMFLNNIVSSISKMNPLIAHILLEIYSKVHDYAPMFATKSLGAIFFLRFISPAFTIPEQLKLISSCTQGLRKKLVIVAKILQTIFNETGATTPKQVWMTPLVPFFIKYNHINKIIHENLLLVIQNRSISKRHYPSINKSNYSKAISEYTRFMGENTEQLLATVKNEQKLQRMSFAAKRARAVQNIKEAPGDIQKEAIEFISWAREYFGRAHLERKRSFIHVGLPTPLMEEIVQYIIFQNSNVEQFIEATQQVMKPKTLAYLDTVINGQLDLEGTPLFIVMQGFFIHLQAQPILKNSSFTHSIFLSKDYAKVLTEPSKLSYLFELLIVIEQDEVDQLSCVLSLFEYFLLASPTSIPSLSIVLFSILFGEDFPREEKELCVNELHIILRNIGSLLSTLPVSIRAKYKIIPSPPSVGRSEWQLFFVHAITGEIPENTVIIDEGFENDDLWYIQSGEIAVYKGTVQLATLRAGHFFGEISLITSKTVSSRVESVSSCIVQRIPYPYLFSIIASDPKLLEKFYYMIAMLTMSRLIKASNIEHYSTRRLDSFSSPREENSLVLPPQDEIPQEIISIEIFFSDGGSQWFECSLTHTAKAISDCVGCSVERGNSTCDVAYARLYESFINPLTDEREFNIIEDTWVVSTIFSRAKYASRHRVYFLTERPSEGSEEFSMSTAFIIKQYTCRVKGTRGILYILPKHIVFVSKSLRSMGQKITKEKEKFIKVSQYHNLAEDGTKISLFTDVNDKQTFRFYNLDDSHQVFLVLQSLHPQLALHSKNVPDSSSLIDIGVANKDYTMRSSERQNSGVSAGDIVQITSRELPFFHVATKGQHGILENHCCVPAECITLLLEPGEVISALIEFHLAATPPSGNMHLPTKSDWVKLLACGRIMEFSHGDMIIRRGTNAQRYYQIICGSCTVAQADREISRLRTGAVFGDISLLLGQSTANVIAGAKDDPTETIRVFTVEAEYFKRLFGRDPQLAGKYYKYISVLCQQRMLLRQQ